MTKRTIHFIPYKATCPMCKREFTVASGRQRFCGSRNDKESCSYKHRLERNRAKSKAWREVDPEKAREMWRKYTKNKAEKRRTKLYGERKCPLCDIRLASCAGGHRKKVYCDDCWETQQKLIQRLATARWRKRQLLKGKSNKHEYKENQTICVS